MDALSYVSPARRLRERELKRDAEARKKLQSDRFKSLGKGGDSFAEVLASVTGSSDSGGSASE